MGLLKKYIDFYTNKLFIGLFVSGVLMTTGCAKKEDVLGTDIKSAESGFTVDNFTVSTKKPDFTKDTVNISAKFNQEVTSTLVIKSLTSGAIKKMTITGTEISESWRGGHQGNQFFNTGDVCTVELSVYGAEDILRDTIVINQGYDFKADNVYNLFPNGFEDAGATGDWWFSSVATVTDASIKPIQGKQYIKFEGKAASGSVYIGGGSYGAWSSDPIKLVSGESAPENPDDVYFNVYAYGTGDTETELFITMFEDDGKQGEAKNTDDGIQIKVTFEHEGWKLLNFKYSDIPFKTYNATTGNNVREPHRFVLLDIALQTTTAGGYGKAIIDFPIITVGEPFDPSKY